MTGTQLWCGEPQKPGVLAEKRGNQETHPPLGNSALEEWKSYRPGNVPFIP